MINYKSLTHIKKQSPYQAVRALQLTNLLWKTSSTTNVRQI